jgi:hypothetical protein
MRMYDYHCKICGKDDHFWFRWSTSRYFNKRKVLDILLEKKNLKNKDDIFQILNGTYRVCG